MDQPLIVELAEALKALLEIAEVEADMPRHYPFTLGQVRDALAKVEAIEVTA